MYANESVSIKPGSFVDLFRVHARNKWTNDHGSI